MTLKSPLTLMSTSKNTPDFNKSIGNDTLKQNIFVNSMDVNPY